MPGIPSGSSRLSRTAGIAVALILGATAIGMQFSAMRGYNRAMNGPDARDMQPISIPAAPASEEVCKTKEDCIDCKKRPEAPEWWTDKK